MDATFIGLFLIATFAVGFTSGLTGFAAGLVVSGIWLHIMTPLQSAVLIAAYEIVNQSYGTWKVRHALQWRRILPFVERLRANRNLSVWFALHVLFGPVQEQQFGPLRWYAFDPLALDPRAAALAVIAALLAFKLHRSLIEVAVVMAVLGAIMQYVL